MNLESNLLQFGRICILRHVVRPALDRTDVDHYDWLIEGTTKLFTWSVDESLMRLSGWMPGNRPIPDHWIHVDAQRTGDHRKFYLDHEGPVSGDRGWVKRVEWGRYSVRHGNGDDIELGVVWEEGPQTLSPRVSQIGNPDKSELDSQIREQSKVRLRIQRTRVDELSSRGSMAWRLSLFGGVDAEGAAGSGVVVGSG